MKFLNLFYFVLIVTFSAPSFAQDADDASVDQEPTTVEALLALVKEGKVKEQAENNKREATFLASKNKQASILAAEKRELARQEKIADKYGYRLVDHKLELYGIKKKN
jgi:Fe2+ or Zn2+ uptake regulation protein